MIEKQTVKHEYRDDDELYVSDIGECALGLFPLRTFNPQNTWSTEPLLDELVLRGAPGRSMHFETLDDDRAYMNITLEDGRIINLNFFVEYDYWITEDGKESKRKRPHLRVAKGWETEPENQGVGQ